MPAAKKKSVAKKSPPESPSTGSGSSTALRKANRRIKELESALKSMSEQLQWHQGRQKRQ